MTRRRRELSDDELALWRYVTRDVTPQRGMVSTPRRPVPDESPAAAPTVAPPSTSSSNAQAKTEAPLALGTSAGIDRRTAQRFARGKMGIDGRLDLHGFTLRDAHDAMNGFVRSSSLAGRRCLLIVTGKGRSQDGEMRGRIRSEALHWLSHPSLRPLILAVREARPEHGGAGALYVLLRRPRTAG